MARANSTAVANGIAAVAEQAANAQMMQQQQQQQHNGSGQVRFDSRKSDTDLPAYSDTVYSDTPPTVTLLAYRK